MTAASNSESRKRLAESAAVEALALDSANERADRWKKRCEDARFDADHFANEYADACKVIERVEALAEKFALFVEANEEVNDAGARSYRAAEKMLRAALRGPR